MLTVLDPGPVPYSKIELFEDPDLELELRDVGLDPWNTSYRLLEIQVNAIDDTRSMPWEHTRTDMIETVRSGANLPPIVVMATHDGWTLLDGVNRTHAYWSLGWQPIQAYELLQACRVYLTSA